MVKRWKIQVWLCLSKSNIQYQQLVRFLGSCDPRITNRCSCSSSKYQLYLTLSIHCFLGSGATSSKLQLQFILQSVNQSDISCSIQKSWRVKNTIYQEPGGISKTNKYQDKEFLFSSSTIDWILMMKSTLMASLLPASCYSIQQWPQQDLEQIWWSGM